MAIEILRARIAEMPPAQYRMLSAAQMARAAGLPETADITAELDALSSGQDACLERWAMLFDADGEYALEPEDLAHFDETGEVVHPETGEVIPDAAGIVSIFYAVREPAPDMPAP